MDFLFPLKTAEMDKKATRFAFRSYSLPIPEVGNFHYGGFYYIGKNAAHIEKLVNIFKGGYASEGLENAKAELLRSLGQEENLIPEVIICEARFDFASLKGFKQYLKNHPVLSGVPFILDGTDLTDKELRLYKTNTKPDEILFLQNCDEKTLKGKVQFLRKIKTALPYAAGLKIEENLSNHHNIGHFFKRCFDILVAGLAICILSPLFLLIALIIKLESRGPVFYIAKRAGRGYKIFDFFKFRTMQQDADKRIGELTHLNQYNANVKGPVFFKINNDPRITRIGIFLRNTSLDELPQLFNVFLGDMSLVGNRPLPLYEAETLTTNKYAARFMAPAGITGLWQIKKRGNKDMSVEERINIDIHYATKYNFVTDLWIIANTPSALLQKENV